MRILRQFAFFKFPVDRLIGVEKLKKDQVIIYFMAHCTFLTPTILQTPNGQVAVELNTLDLQRRTPVVFFEPVNHVI